MDSIPIMCALSMLCGIVHAKESTTTSSPLGGHRYLSSPIIPNLSRSAGDNYMLECILGSAVVFIVVTACLIINALRNRRKRRSKPTTYNVVKQRCGRQNTATTSHNVLQSMLIVHTNEGQNIILKENNTSYNVTDFTNIPRQIHEIQNTKDLYAESDISNVHTDSIIPSSCGIFQSESPHTYENVREYDELEYDYQPDQRYGLKLSANSAETFSDKSFGYNYVAHHKNKTLLPPKPDHVVTKETRKKVAKSYAMHTNVNKESPSSVDSSTLYANDNHTRLNEIRCTGRRLEPGSGDFSNTLSPPSKLVDTYLVDSVDPPNNFQRRRCYRKRNSDFFKSNIYINISESREIYADIKDQSVKQTLHHDCLRNVLPHSSAFKKGLRRSQSCGALYENLMFESSVRISRSISARASIDEDCYESC